MGSAIKHLQNNPAQQDEYSHSLRSCSTSCPDHLGSKRVAKYPDPQSVPKQACMLMSQMPRGVKHKATSQLIGPPGDFLMTLDMHFPSAQKVPSAISAGSWDTLMASPLISITFASQTARKCLVLSTSCGSLMLCIEANPNTSPDELILAGQPRAIRSLDDLLTTMYGGFAPSYLGITATLFPRTPSHLGSAFSPQSGDWTDGYTDILGHDHERLVLPLLGQPQHGPHPGFLATEYLAEIRFLGVSSI
ncbi:hypothetical protein FB45DRAFT_864406 [Roridomyces roridus]|uniref:Uncharacterized protein n=1 Tax=Roridomyces roridus TaxID=1738132 RepID=A0AAD7C139_9AGAR|nr:hypothetical protein FB45DRAFT_864406 [Roridomyces roridus]